MFVLGTLVSADVGSWTESAERMHACKCSQCRIMGPVAKVIATAYAAASLACSGNRGPLDELLGAARAALVKMGGTHVPDPPPT